MWFMRRLWHRLRDFLRWQLPQGLKNLWKFRGAVWNFNDGDAEDTLRFMQVGFKAVSDHLKKHNIKLHDARRAKEAWLASEMCRRIADETYMDEQKFFYFANRKVKYEYLNARVVYKQDLEYLRYLLRRLPNWWC